MKGVIVAGFALACAGCGPVQEAQSWLTWFGYADESVHQVEVGTFGYPFFPVSFGRDTLWLPLDTGNMVGLTLEAEEFRRLDLPCSDRTNRRDSAGRLVSSSCVAHGVEAALLGARYDSISVFEFEHESLPGLVGPETIPGTRFTVDYGAGLLAVDDAVGPDTVPGFASLPLVRSPQLPLLVLVRGRVQGRDVLVEIDTGKSRTTVDRRLVDLLAMDETPGGAQVGVVELGPRTWTVDRARVVDTSGISRGLPEPISLGIGSDLLAGFVFTVDYRAGRLWIELVP